MVRTVLEEKGMDTMPAEIHAEIKKRFNVDMPTQQISNYKFQIRKKSGKAGPGRGRRAAPAGGLRVEDFQVLRGLVQRLGADQVKQMVDVVG
jgi:hypothetical protein